MRRRYPFGKFQVKKPLSPSREATQHNQQEFPGQEKEPFMSPLVGVNRPGNRVVVHSLECHHEAALPFWNRARWKD